uniref:Uncharacterized protein n=1 Tax=Solanum lycopersicum TaxID=4081 RepID=A0A3Q7G934_SOLLC
MERLVKSDVKYRFVYTHGKGDEEKGSCRKLTLVTNTIATIAFYVRWQLLWVLATENDLTRRHKLPQ